MDPAGRTARMSRTMSEALNGLSVFLCEPTFRQLQLDHLQELGRWEREYGDVMRHCGSSLIGAGRRRFLSGLEALSAAIRQGGAVDAELTLGAVRAAARDVLTGLGTPLPDVGPAESQVCTLHGAACPAVVPK